VSSVLSSRRGRILAGGALAAIVVFALAVLALGGGGDDVVVYNGRSQYGDEEVFRQFERERGVGLQLRGGTAPELFTRLRSEGDETPADLLVTTDLANLWRAQQAGLLEASDSAALRTRVPRSYRARDGSWWGLSLRIRTPMRSTERVLRSWMANDPRILGSDVDVLEAIASGRCDAGLTNHYYLARILAGDARFPVAPAWPDQDGAGAHTNLSGAGLVKGSDRRDDAVALMEHLTSAAGQREIVANGELAVNPRVPPAAHIRAWDGVKKDPIDVARAGRLLPDAVALMEEVGWR
jgi:iron(III) transport system substrate-binding protein